MMQQQPGVLYVELPGYLPLPPRDVLQVSGHGGLVHAVSDETAAEALIQSSQSLRVVVCNAPSTKVFSVARKHPKAETVLVTDMIMDLYSKKLDGIEEKLIDHVVANRGPVEWTTNDLRTTVQKILTNDLFGIEKYLSPSAQIYEITISSSAERETYNSQVMRFSESCKLGSHVSKAIWGISEELLMNAIYDAPAAAGISRYIDLPRTAKIELLESERSVLRYGCDGDYFALSVTDPFGLLTKEKLFEYLKKVLRRADSGNLIDTKKGGAGLGIFKMLYSCHGLICNVEPNKRTEVISLIDISEPLRDFGKMTRSIHFFTK